MKKGIRRKSLFTTLWAVAFLITILVAAVWLAPLHADDDDVFVEGQVVVKLDPASGATIEAINATYGTTIVDTLLGSAGIYLLQIAPGQTVEGTVGAMAGDSRLLFVEPNFTGELPEGDPSGTWAWGGYDDGPYLEQYAADMLNLAEAHAVTLGAGAVVAVLDTGAQLDHPRLAGRFTAARYDFIDDDTIPEDESNGLDDDGDSRTDEGRGHGTHVTGLVNLVAPQAQIMPLRILDSDGRGNEFLIAEAIHYAVANGAEVINLSLGMSADSELIEDIIEDTVDAGVVIVAAAGNLNSSTEQYPAANENVLAVTAVGPTYAKSSFANYGAWVDIATPGESITSTFPIDGYARWSGTSMATSFVSGQATLIRSVSPTMPVADVAWLIRSTARPLDDFNPGHQGLLGAGLADIGATLRQGISGVSCGQVLTTSVVVANNLTDCPGDGLVIGAAGITVDLNGRTIDGVGLGSGIRNDGFDSVTITNGTVQEFDVGVYLNAGAALNTVSSLTLQLNQEAGIQLSAAGNGNTIQANTIAGNATGLVLSDSTGAVIAANTVTGNSGYCLHLLNASGNVLEANLFTGSSDLAVFLEGANGNTLIGNTITDSSDSALLLQGASGNTLLGNTILNSGDSAIALLAGSNDNQVEGNTLTGGGDAGIAITDSLGNYLIANAIHDMSDSGIFLNNGHHGVVRGNDLRFNVGGIELDTSTGNLIELNDASYSAGTGIELSDESLGNIVILNVASFNGAKGISVEAEVLPESPDLGNLLDGNTASGNQSDGIAVTKAGHTIIANLADDNAGWGIYAEAGNSDDGGNSATGNAVSSQCFNVACNGGGSPPPPPPPPPDITPPETTIDSGPAATTTDTSATFTFSADKPDATFECSLDATAFAVCVSPAEYTGLAAGGHTFAVQASDPAGNTDATPATYPWTVEAPPPVECGAPVTLLANADAWIDQNSSSNNFGADSILKVQAKSSNNFRALVRFTLPALPAGCVVQSATLSLYAASWTNNRTLQALRISGAWSENQVTWSNQPATTGPAATTSSGSGYRQWNVAAQVQAMFDAGASQGFLIRDANESGSGKEQQFHSREKGENLPMLVITFAPAGG